MRSVLLLLGLTLAAAPPTLKRAESRPINDTVAEDPAVLKAIEPAKNEIAAGFGQVIVKSPKGLFRGRGGEENFMGYWIADTMRARAAEAVGAPVRFALTNAGGVRGNLRAGDIKVGDIFEVMPFENEMVVVELTGAEVMSAVKEGLVRRGGEPCSGVKAVVTGTPQSPVLAVTWADGSAIDPQAMVKVATSDYLFNGGDSIPSLRKGRRAYTTGLTIRQILLDACRALDKAGKPLEAPPGGRYLLPPEIVQAIRDKQFSLPR
jgi:2',3'-cyclic-nucleotide 2'-phosphodiesterase (5'-nucleotidase family)